MSVRFPRPSGRSAALRVLAAVLSATIVGLLAACTTTSSSPVETRVVDGPADQQPDKARLAKLKLELAAAYFSRGQYATALDAVAEALQADPRSVSGYNLRGLIQAAMGDLPKADDSFRQALRLNAADGDTLHNYGWFLCQQRRFDEADAQFAAAEQAPGYLGVSRSMMARGICQARNQRLEQAERTLLRAYELDPASPATAVNLSEVLYRRGEYERARFYIRRVNVNDDLVSAQTLWLAARIERKLGQTAQVQSLGNQLRNRFPDSPEALRYERGAFDD